MFLHPRRGDQGSNRDERKDSSGEASLRCPRTEEGGQEDPPGRPVQPEDGGDADAGNGGGDAADGAGRVHDAAAKYPAATACPLLCPDTYAHPAQVASTTAAAATGHDETEHGNAWHGRDGWDGHARRDGGRTRGSDGDGQDGSADQADDGPADANDGEAGNASRSQHGWKPGETSIFKPRPHLTKNIPCKQPRSMAGYKFTPTVRNPQFQVLLHPALLIFFTKLCFHKL